MLGKNKQDQINSLERQLSKAIEQREHWHDRYEENRKELEELKKLPTAKVGDIVRYNSNEGRQIKKIVRVYEDQNGDVFYELSEPTSFARNDKNEFVPHSSVTEILTEVKENS